MGNLGGGEILVILLVALIVLGPTKLPPAVRQVGKVVGEIRRIGQGFQEELREASKPLAETTAAMKAADPRKVIAPPPETKGKGGDVAKKARDASDKSTDESGPASWGTAAAPASAALAAQSDDAGTESTDQSQEGGVDHPAGEDGDGVVPPAGENEEGEAASPAGEAEEADGAHAATGEGAGIASDAPSAAEPDADGSEADENAPKSPNPDTT